jgi:hypothetical protein
MGGRGEEEEDKRRGSKLAQKPTLSLSPQLENFLLTVEWNSVYHFDDLATMKASF